MSATPAIEARALSKLYAPGVGISEIDLRVERGEVFGFIGPNGAGKTTFIRTMLDLIRPTAGAVEVLGFDSRRQSLEVRGRCGYLPGELKLSGHDTGRQVLDHLARLRGVAPDTAAGLIDRLGLEPDRRIADLSKGNRQKIGLIAALLADPELLVLDEPTSGLDPLLQEEVHAIVREHAAAGSTVFLSSHDLDEVERAADRVAIIRAGRIVDVQGVAELRARRPRETSVILAEPLEESVAARLRGLDCVHDLTLDGARLRFATSGEITDLIRLLAEQRVLSLTSREPELEELFLRYYEDPGGAAGRGEGS